MSHGSRLHAAVTIVFATTAATATACAPTRGARMAAHAAAPDVQGRGREQAENQMRPPPGTLTAGLWDDNLNFDFYLAYLREVERQQPPGLVVIPRHDRLVIQVTTDGGAPVAGAEVTVAAPGAASFRSITGADGRVLYFPTWAGAHAGATLTVAAAIGQRRTEARAPARGGALDLVLPGARGGGPRRLDVALVIDTTGSMGDEIRYLQSEVDALAGGLARRFPSLDVRWSLVVYRDEGDDYVVRPFDFVADLGSFRRSLGAQSADGGGDYPEAPDQALRATTDLSWRDGATARVLFWLADAPHHVGREAAMAGSYTRAIERGVHIYPVAASSADDVTEHAMRTAAEVTGGRYLFLTDDSGVGLAHKEPRIPCYFVTTLLAAMERSLRMELEGAWSEPAREEILRTGGDPQARTCRTPKNQTVTAI
jgi:hypothetical protein